MEQWKSAAGWQRALYRFAFTPIGFTLVVPFSTFAVLHRFVSRWYEIVLDVIFWAIMWYVHNRQAGTVGVAASTRSARDRHYHAPILCWNSPAAAAATPAGAAVSRPLSCGRSFARASSDSSSSTASTPSRARVARSRSTGRSLRTA